MMTIDNFIRGYASPSPEIEKANYVIRLCGTLNIPERQLSRDCFKGHLISQKTHLLEKIIFSQPKTA
jgi:hypothetical protein